MGEKVEEEAVVGPLRDWRETPRLGGSKARV